MLLKIRIPIKDIGAEAYAKQQILLFEVFIFAVAEIQKSFCRQIYFRVN